MMTTDESGIHGQRQEYPPHVKEMFAKAAGQKKKKEVDHKHPAFLIFTGIVFIGFLGALAFIFLIGNGNDGILTHRPYPTPGAIHQYKNTYYYVRQQMANGNTPSAANLSNQAYCNVYNASGVSGTSQIPVSNAGYAGCLAAVSGQTPQQAFNRTFISNHVIPVGRGH